MSKSRDQFYSFLTLGNAEVGKTCFILRYCENGFQDVHLMTMGVDFKSKEETVEVNNSKKIITVKIFDTCGQERFKSSLTKNYYKAADGILLMYDVTKTSTFEGVKDWIEQIKEKAPSNICIILIGNKIDDINKREVSTEAGSQLARESNMEFFEVSAKENVGIRDSVLVLVNQVMKVKKETQGMALERKNNSSEKKCCK